MYNTKKKNNHHHPLPSSATVSSASASASTSASASSSTISSSPPLPGPNRRFSKHHKDTLPLPLPPSPIISPVSQPPSSFFLTDVDPNSTSSPHSGSAGQSQKIRPQTDYPSILFSDPVTINPSLPATRNNNHNSHVQYRHSHKNPSDFIAPIPTPTTPYYHPQHHHNHINRPDSHYHTHHNSTISNPTATTTTSTTTSSRSRHHNKTPSSENHLLSNSIISTDDDTELSSSSSSSSSSCSLNETDNILTNSLNRDIFHSINPEAANLFLSNKKHPHTSSSSSSAIRRNISYDDIADDVDDTYEEDIIDLNENNNTNSLSYLPSASISNSAAFSRALGRTLEPSRSAVPLNETSNLSPSVPGSNFRSTTTTTTTTLSDSPCSSANETPTNSSHIKPKTPSGFDTNNTRQINPQNPSNNAVPSSSSSSFSSFSTSPSSLHSLTDPISRKNVKQKISTGNNKNKNKNKKSPGSCASPKFVMPKVSIPSRRPFTTDGLALGKLKILVAGDSGSGKSQLIKAIAKTSKEIIHVNDFPTPVIQKQHQSQDSNRKPQTQSTQTPTPSFFNSNPSYQNNNINNNNTNATDIPKSTNRLHRSSLVPNTNANNNNATNVFSLREPLDPTSSSPSPINVYDSIREEPKKDETIIALWEFLASTRPHLDFSSSSESENGDDDYDDDDDDNDDDGHEYENGDAYGNNTFNSNIHLKPKAASTSRRTSIAQSSSISSDVSALEKNVCFVDTLGYGSFADASKCISRIVEYLEDAFEKTSTLVNPSNKEALTILSSTSSLDAVPLVDVCLYTVTNRLKPVDIEYIWHLSQFTPVIPVIVRSDLLPAKELLSLKLSILEDLKKAEIPPFLFDASLDESINIARKNLKQYSSRNSSISNSTFPFSTSSSSSKDSSANASTSNQVSNSMSSYFAVPRTFESSLIDLGDLSDGVLDSEASLLLESLELANTKQSENNIIFPCAVSTITGPYSDAHLSPEASTSSPSSLTFYPSELSDLCAHLFSYHGAVWLRRVAAKKFISWCSSKYVSGTLQFQMQHPLSQPSLVPSPEASNPNTTLICRDGRNELGLLPSTTASPQPNSHPTSIVPACSQYGQERQRMPFLLDDDFLFHDFNVMIDIPDIVLENRRQAQSGTSRWVMEIAQSEGILCYTTTTTTTTGNTPNGNEVNINNQGSTTRYYQSESNQQLQLRPVFALSTTRVDSLNGDIASSTVPGGLQHSRQGRNRSSRHYQAESQTRANSLGRSSRNVRGHRSSYNKHSSSITNIDPLDIWGMSFRIWNFTIKALSVAFGIKMIIEIYNETGAGSAPSVTATLSMSSESSSQSMISTVVSSTFTTINGFIKALTIPLENILSAMTASFTSDVNSSAAAPPSSSSPFFIPFADSISKENIRPQSILAAIFSGQLQENLFAVILGSLGGGWSQLV